ncbi:MAG TPA: hypothetical protein VFW69_17735 [Mycobacterium sp.]|nr:hypothetical protein [Mycobacterium sp.]
MGLGAAGAAIAQAQPTPFPVYHWCPGQFYDPGWGPNWDAFNCHDDRHRDIDGDDHHRDFGGPGGYDRGPYDRGPYDHGPYDRGPYDHGPGEGWQR